MANETKPVDIEKETSMGAYLWKQLYQQAVGLGSLIGGTYLGLMASKPFFKNVDISERAAEIWQQVPAFVKKIPGFSKPMTGKQLAWGGGVGAFLGSLTAGIILGYEHWKKIKQSQLQVDEITRDISQIEVFKKTDPELKAENERLWAELKKREAGQGTMAEKVGSQKKESWVEGTSAAPETVAEASR